MFRDAINYPRRGEDLGRKYLIGSLLTLSSILIIPNLILLGAPGFILLGYLIKVMNRTLQGKNELPRFEEYKNLLIDGLKATGIMLTYVLIPTILISLLNTLSSGSAAGLIDGVGVLILIGALYLVPSALVNFARYLELSAGFNLKHVVDKAFRKKYLIGIINLIAALVVITIAQFATLFILMISIIGTPAIIGVWPAMRFYENLVYFRMMAKMAD